MEVGQAAVMAVVGSHLVAGRVAQHEDVLDVLLADRLPRRLGEDLHHVGYGVRSGSGGMGCGA